MTVKATRQVTEERVDYTPTSTGLAGSIWFMGSGDARWDGATAAVFSNASGKIPVGVCYWDVVSIAKNTTGSAEFGNSFTDRTFPNFLSGCQIMNEKMTLLTKATIITDRIYGTPAAGDDAYAYGDGKFATKSDADTQCGGAGTAKKVGRFDSAKDGDGFCKVTINI